jgi:hypothetical protein
VAWKTYVTLVVGSVKFEMTTRAAVAGWTDMVFIVLMDTSIAAGPQADVRRMAYLLHESIRLGVWDQPMAPDKHYFKFLSPYPLQAISNDHVMYNAHY